MSERSDRGSVVMCRVRLQDSIEESKRCLKDTNSCASVLDHVCTCLFHTGCVCSTLLEATLIMLHIPHEGCYVKNENSAIFFVDGWYYLLAKCEIRDGDVDEDQPSCFAGLFCFYRWGYPGSSKSGLPVVVLDLLACVIMVLFGSWWLMVDDTKPWM